MHTLYFKCDKIYLMGIKIQIFVKNIQIFLGMQRQEIQWSVARFM